MSTPLTDAIEALTTYANEVTGASDADLSAAVATLAAGYGGGSAASGTFTPTENVRSIVISDAIGKTNIIVYPKFDLSTITTRTHWGCVIIGGREILRSSTNTAGNSYIFNATRFAASGSTSSSDTFDSTTGTLTIVAGAGSNYGGYFLANSEYGYIAW